MSVFQWLPWVRARRDAELASEICAHLEMAEADRVARGESPASAAASARREFGNVGVATELARDQWGWVGMWLERLGQDVRFAFRTLRRAPAFTIAAIFTIAIGVGGSTALFSVVDSALLRPLPYAHPEQLVRIEDDLAGAGSRDIGMSTPEWRDLQSSGVFAHVSPTWFDNNNLTGLPKPQRVSILIVAANYFAMLGVHPQLGVTFDPSDHTPGFNQQAVISDGLWKRAFGANPNVIGRVIRLDSDSYRIIGVMPPAFQAPENTREQQGTEVWIAFGFAGAPLDAAMAQSRASLFPGAIARVAPGFSIAEAQRRVNALVRSLRRQYPADYPAASDWQVRLVPLAQNVVGDVRQPLMLLLAAVGVVLLIGCANVANLMLARASTRGREIAVRQAIGGAQSRIVRQLLTESIVLGLVGGLVGVAFVLTTKSWLVRLVPDSFPRLNEITIDWTVLVFGVAVSLLAGALFGLAPALRARRVDVTLALRQEGRGATGGGEQRRTRRALVVVEFALSLMLLSASALLARSVWDLVHVPLGFEPRSITVVRTRLPYPNDPAEDHYATVADEARFVREVLRRCRSLAAVTNVALGSGAAVPLDHPSQDQPILHLVFERGERTSDQPFLVNGSEVTPDYFRLIGIPLIRGRLLEDYDTDQSPQVAVINEAMARAVWPGQNAIGKRIKLSPRATSWATIVGIVADARTESLARAGEPQLYASLYQRAGKHLAIFVQGGPETAALERQVREQVQSIDPTLPVFGAVTLNQTVATSVAVRRLSLKLIGLFASIALVLSALGIYGVVSYTVSERLPEIGVRLALGADQSEIMRMVMRQGLLMALVGGAVGIAGSLIASRLLSGALVGVRPSDPLSLIGSVLLLTFVAVAGCYLPARRAMRVEPSRALRG
jgi:predicted permease